MAVELPRGRGNSESGDALVRELHPIVAQMGPSAEQLPAILARRRDVVVTAGAGTGKTRTLVARYLSLLAEGLPLRSIVAITFTRKAAREMRNRVRDEMRRYLRQAGLGDKERRKWQQLYTELDAARIGTIHSLCTEILRSHPVEAQVDPRFEVLDEGQTNILRAQAVDQALTWAADDEVAATLFMTLGERLFRSALDALMQQRLAVQDVVDHRPADYQVHWERSLADRREECLTNLVAQPEWTAAVATLKSNAALNPDDLAELERQKALRALRDANGSVPDSVSALADLGRISLRGGSSKAWPGGKAQVNDVKSALRKLRDLWGLHSETLELTLNPLDETLARITPVLHTAFELACTRYDALKRERQALDFDDLEHRALVLLEEHTAVCARWQREVQAILVDEFQDTNDRQRVLVRLLNGSGGRLFIVGDAKQSIYRFRGADVAVFRGERRRIEEEEGGAGYSLDTSYRAHRDLIRGLNDLLRPVLGEEGGNHRPWVEPFARLMHYREESGLGFEPPHIELHLTVGSKSTGALNRAAAAVAGQVVQLVEGGAQVEDDGRLRTLDYGDVAILCRASGSFFAYENALEEAGVPFLTVAGRGFYGRPEIRDLLNALQAIADPTDSLALAGLLRSPALALSDIALYHLCQARRRAEGSPSLWDTLQERGAGLSEEDGRRAQRAARIVSQLHNQVGRVSVADLLKAFLDMTHYRAALIKADQARAARNVSKLLADAHASNIVGVGEFLEYVNSLRDVGTREGEARSTAEGAVQIMSVHAAKGLEFPVVVIGDITYRGRGRNPVLVDPELGVLLPLRDDEDQLPAVYRLAKMRSDDREAAELDRLLYVAATRAREKLILNGYIRLKRDGHPGRPGGWLDKISGPDALGLTGTQVPHEEEGASAIRLDLRVGGTRVPCTIYEPRYLWRRRPLKIETAEQPPAVLTPSLLSAVPWLAEDVDQRTVERERTPRRRVWRVVPAVKRPRAPARVVGLLVHEALAAWRFPDGTFERWVKARARGHGITDPRQLVDAAAETKRLLNRFRAHSLYREMNRADRRLHEVPYSILVDGRVDSGRIDALVLQDGLWTIAEFKTDKVGNETGFWKTVREGDYLGQAHKYLAAAEGLLGQRPRFILCMLDYAGAVVLHALKGGTLQRLS